MEKGKRSTGNKTPEKGKDCEGDEAVLSSINSPFVSLNMASAVASVMDTRLSL